MVQNKFKKIILSIALLTSSLSVASESLIGVEGSYSSLNSELSYASNPTAYSQNKAGLGAVGLKIGAQSDAFRIFLSTRYYFDERNEYEYITTYGGELQYFFNISKETSVFVGVGGGVMNVKFAIPSESYSRTMSNPYVSGEIGANVHISKITDFEIGTRIINTESQNLRNGVNYRLNNIVSGYMSLIFRWTMK